MLFIKVYVHTVWSIKHREPLFTTIALRRNVWEHIRKNALEKGMVVDTINGYNDHFHCLISLRSDKTIQKVIQLIKGESS